MLKKIILSVLVFGFFLIIFHTTLVKPSFSLECEGIADIPKRKECLEQALNKTKVARTTLSSEVNYMNTQIELTELQIQQIELKIVQTANEINTLNDRIDGLDNSLDYLSKQLLERVVDAYKKQSNNSMLSVMLNSIDAQNLLNRFKYVKTARDNNQKLLVQVQQAKLNFEDQKKLRETKKVQLDELNKTLITQETNLNAQKSQKQKLLAQTQNDEKIYQQMLERTRAENAAIQGIVAGNGTESLLREVKKGDVIANIIGGASCNSSGGHLHFIVQEGNSVMNPFNYLKGIEFSNCSGSSCGSSDGDSFNPAGNFDWPLRPSITMNQGFGVTWAVNNTWAGRVYNFHNGIDITGSSSEVIAVADGSLYKGGYSVGCVLPYAKIVHKDSNISTLYLHVYIQ